MGKLKSCDTCESHVAFVITEEESKMIDALKSPNICVNSDVTRLYPQSAGVSKLYEHFRTSRTSEPFLIFW